MAANDKDTIYIDIDDEITGIIDKLRGSDGKIVALVLPKRATVLQSIVNMRLLKRAAEQSKKNLVLITSEAGLMPLAGLAGVHVAKTLTSKPEIPLAPGMEPEDDEPIQEDTGELPADAAEKPVGELAGAGAVAATGKDDMETLTLDDDEAPETLDDTPAAKTKTFEPPKKNKKLAVPNFDRFRLWLVLGGLAAILLIGGLIYSVVVLPKAVISIKTDATNVTSDLNLNLSTSAKTLKPSNSTIPAKLVSQQKSFTGQVTTTGQKNNGNKASGSASLTNCSQVDDITVPAGTGLSSNGNTYITQSTVTVPASSFKKNVCQNDGKATVSIVAQSPGTGSNGATTFTVAGFKDISASAASQISGGTDNIVQVASATDISNAKSKLNAGNNDSAAKQALISQLKGEGYFAIAATYNAGTPSVTTSVNAGDPATTVTATETITYTMFGVHQDDLQELVENDIKSQIDTNKQSILDNGIDKASYVVNNSTQTDAQVAMHVVATAGPDLNIDEIKQMAAGKKPPEVRSAFTNNPDVTDVDVKLSPFFVSSVPKKTDRITVHIAKPSTTKPSSNGSNP